MGEEGRLEASADFALPDALLFVNCNPRNSARVAIEDAALKGRLYARRKKKDRLLEALTGQASVTKKADPSMRGSRAIVVQLAWQMNRRCRPTLRLPQGKKERRYKGKRKNNEDGALKGRWYDGERKNKEDGAALKKRAFRSAVR